MRWRRLFFDDAGAPDGGTESMPDWQLSWAVRAGGEEYDWPDSTIPRETGWAIAVLEDGSVYVTGLATEQAVFGEGEPNESLFPEHTGWSDAFLAKYGPDGRLAWVRRIGGPDEHTGDYGHDVAVLEDGSAVVVGRFDSPEIVLGEGEPNETVLTGIDESYDIKAFIARYAPEGDLAWAVQIPRANETYVEAETVHALADGRILVSGGLNGTAWPGEPIEISSMPSATSAENWDGFLAWYDEDGTVSHAARIGNDSNDSFHAVAATGDGGAIAAMFYFGENVDHSGEETFGLGEPNETVLHCDDDVGCSSLARYDDHGHLLWVRDLGIFNPTTSLNVTVLENGDIGLVAQFAGPSDPDGDGVFFDVNSADNTFGSVVAVYRVADGEFVWARMGSFIGNSRAAGNVFAMPGSGLVAGFAFEHMLTFEGDDDGQRILVSGGDSDIMLMSLSAAGEILWMHSMGGVGEECTSFGAQMNGSSIWLTGAYGSNPFVATSGHGDDVELSLDGISDIFLMRFDATTLPTE